jgi:siroheme synthase (precorrin-2 oxidase/ferrochelatase)
LSGSEARTTQRNGRRARLLSTEAGDEELAIPKLRRGSTAPLQASSGRTEWHRLDRARNRWLNKAFYVIAITQSGHDERAIASVARKRTKGKTRRESSLPQAPPLRRHLPPAPRRPATSA